MLVLNVKAPDLKSERKLVNAMHSAVHQARRLGHRPDRFSPDVEGYAALTGCQDCGRFVCVDLTESQEPYGSGTTEPCRPKRRR